MFGFWGFRPSALKETLYEAMSPDDFIRMYHQDSLRAQHERVFEDKKSESTKIRTCQWNINCFQHAQRTLGTSSAMAAAKEIANELLKTDADVFILNEFGKVEGPRWNLFALEEQIAAQELMSILKGKGYQTVFVANCPSPTAVVTRLPVSNRTFMDMDGRHAAVGVELQLKDGMTAWVYGTQLDDENRFQGMERLREMDALLNQVKECAGKTHLILGDFNQEREQDYTPEEWWRISRYKGARSAPKDDGVAGALHRAGFSSAWDAQGVTGNWNANEKPPSTHSTGTIVDYAYAKGATPNQILVGSSTLSNHRLVAVDWTI